MSELEENHGESKGKGQMFVLAVLGLIAIIYGFNYMSEGGGSKPTDQGEPVEAKPIAQYDDVDELKNALAQERANLAKERDKNKALGQMLIEGDKKLESAVDILDQKEKLIEDYEVKMSNIRKLIHADKILSETEEVVEPAKLILDNP